MAYTFNETKYSIIFGRHFNMASLSLKNVCKVYPNGFEAVKNFNLEIADKEFIIFVGPSVQFLLRQLLTSNPPASLVTSVFLHSSHNHAPTNHHRSHHLTRQACSANQGLRAGHPPNMGLFTTWSILPSC